MQQEPSKDEPSKALKHLLYTEEFKSPDFAVSPFRRFDAVATSKRLF